MELIVEQNKMGYNYHYKIYNGSGLIYKAKVNRTIVPLFRIVSLADLDGNEVCILKQENLIKFIFSYIPFIGWLSYFSCPYNLYENKVKQGAIRNIKWRRKKEPDISGKIGNNNYSIYSHTGEEYSIFLNDKQEGLITHEHWKVGDGDRYKIIHSSKLRSEFTVLFCILVDILWATTDTSIASFSYQNTWIIGERKKDENWAPED